MDILGGIAQQMQDQNVDVLLGHFQRSFRIAPAQRRSHGFECFHLLQIHAVCF